MSSARREAQRSGHSHPIAEKPAIRRDGKAVGRVSKRVNLPFCAVFYAHFLFLLSLSRLATLQATSGGKTKTLNQCSSTQRVLETAPVKKQKLAMASAEGGEQEGCGNQLAIPEDATAPHESQLAIPDGPQEQLMPEHYSIGTKNAFRDKKAWSYKKKHLKSETIYVSDKGSKCARKDEVLVLRRVDMMWTAFDCVLTADGKIHHQRQAVFRSHEADITRQGWHKWQMNDAASVGNDGSEEEWGDLLWAQTRYD